MLRRDAGTDGDAGGKFVRISADQPQRRFTAQSVFDRTGRFSRGRTRCNERGLDLLGWYHSHPITRAPERVRSGACLAWYSYVIVSVEAGNPKDLTSWRLEDDRSKFHPEEVLPVRQQARESRAELGCPR